MRKLLLLFVLIPSLVLATDQNQITVIPDSFVELEGGGNWSYSTGLVDNTGDRRGYVFQAMAADTITSGCVYQTAVTGAPTTFTVGIQPVGTDGYPTGTYTQSASMTIAGTGVKCTTFTGVALTLGTWYALVGTPSGTWGAATNDITLRTTMSNTDITGNAYYVTADNGGAYSRTSTVPNMWVKSATKTYGFPFTGNCSEAGTCNTSSGTTEVGLKFTLPATCSTTQLLGVKCEFGIPVAGTLTMALYSGGLATDTTALTSIAMDTDNFDATGSSRLRAAYFSSLQTLTCGNTYRISLMPTSQTLTLKDVSVPANADLTALGGGQENFYYTTRNGGNWTDTTTRRPVCGLILNDITSAAAGGALSPITINGGVQ